MLMPRNNDIIADLLCPFCPADRPVGDRLLSKYEQKTERKGEDGKPLDDGIVAVKHWYACPYGHIFPARHVNSQGWVPVYRPPAPAKEGTT